MGTQHHQLKTYRTANWQGYVRADWTKHFEAHDPFISLREQPLKMVRDRFAAQTWCIETACGVLYVKLIRALKDSNPAGQGAWNHLRWTWGPSRALGVARVTRRLNEAGLHTPPIVLAARRRQGWKVEELLVTEEVSHHPFGVVLRRPDKIGMDRTALLNMLGQSIATLHQRGFTHGDLNPNNVLVSLDGSSLIYIDNERTRHWWPRPPHRLRRRNVAQMLYRLLPPLGYRGTQHFLESYWGTLGITGTLRRREQYAVLRWAHRRFHERKRPYPRHRRITEAPVAAR